MTRVSPRLRLDVGQGVVDDGEVAQAEEVHLQQAERLARRVVELGDDRAVLLPLHDRDRVDQRLARHDHRAGVHAPLPLEPLEALCGLDDPLDLGVGLAQGPELAALAVTLVTGVEELVQRHVLAHDRRRHGLGDALAHRERVAQDARRVLDRLLGLDRAVGDDLGDPVVAVLVGDVRHDLTPAAFVEVDVDVGHRDPLGVEEPLEQQPVLERIELGDAHRVGDKGSGRRPPARADPDALGPGPGNEIGNHQEIAGKTHADDHRDFVVGPGADVGRDPRGIRRNSPSSTSFTNQEFSSSPVGHREPGHEVGALGEADLAALGDQQGVVAGLAQLVLVGPERAHLRRGLEVEVAGVELEAVGVGHRLAGLHAEQHLVGVGVVGVRVVQVVRGDHRQVRSRARRSRSSCTRVSMSRP